MPSKPKYTAADAAKHIDQSTTHHTGDLGSSDRGRLLGVIAVDGCGSAFVTKDAAGRISVGPKADLCVSAAVAVSLLPTGLLDSPHRFKPILFLAGHVGEWWAAGPVCGGRGGGRHHLPVRRRQPVAAADGGGAGVPETRQVLSRVGPTAQTVWQLAAAVELGSRWGRRVVQQPPQPLQGPAWAAQVHQGRLQRGGPL